MFANVVEQTGSDELSVFGGDSSKFASSFQPMPLIGHLLRPEKGCLFVPQPRGDYILLSRAQPLGKKHLEEPFDEVEDPADELAGL